LKAELAMAAGGVVSVKKIDKGAVGLGCRSRGSSAMFGFVSVSLGRRQGSRAKRVMPAKRSPARATIYWSFFKSDLASSQP
jgi:hypothetical protein